MNFQKEPFLGENSPNLRPSATRMAGVSCSFYDNCAVPQKGHPSLIFVKQSEIADSPSKNHNLIGKKKNSVKSEADTVREPFSRQF